MLAKMTSGDKLDAYDCYSVKITLNLGLGAWKLLLNPMKV
jgi:hypothetical protein